MYTFTCTVCNQTLPVHAEGGTGYGVDPKTDGKVCYECCGKQDLASMRESGKFTGYLTFEVENGIRKPIVTNWPGTLRLPCYGYSNSRTNWNHIRNDVWFVLDGVMWHGVHIGDNNQIVRCKRTKQIWKHGS